GTFSAGPAAEAGLYSFVLLGVVVGDGEALVGEAGVSFEGCCVGVSAFPALHPESARVAAAKDAAILIFRAFM
ncbi:MAG: hypothetical protein ACTH8G_06010, partial [Glutamicibacter arilaitensis]